MDGHDIFLSTWNGYHGPLVEGVNKAISHLLSAVAVELTGALGLVVIVLGVMMTLGRMSWNVGFLYMLRAIIVAAVLKGTAYNTYVVELFMNKIPAWIVRAVGTGNGPEASAEQFAKLHSAIEHMSAALLLEANGFLQMPTRISINLATAACETTLIISFVIYVLAFAVMGVVVAAGPPILVLWLFNGTKQWAERWVGKLVSLSILLLFISILLDIVMTQNAAYMRAAEAAMGGDLDQKVAVLWHVFGGLLVGAAVLITLPMIASAIGGSAVMGTNLIFAPIRFGAGVAGRMGGSLPSATTLGSRAAAAIRR